MSVDALRLNTPPNLPTMTYGGTRRLREMSELHPDKLPTHNAVLEYCYGETYDRRAETDFLADYCAVRQLQRQEVWVKTDECEGLYAVPDGSEDGYSAFDPLLNPTMLLYGDWLCLGFDADVQQVDAPSGVFDGYGAIARIEPIIDQSTLDGMAVMVPNPRKFVLLPHELDAVEEFTGLNLAHISNVIEQRSAK